MPEIVADPRSASCYRLFFGAGIAEFQLLGSDLIWPRARERNRPVSGSGALCGFGLPDRAELQRLRESRC